MGEWDHRLERVSWIPFFFARVKLQTESKKEGKYYEYFAEKYG